MRYYDTYQTPRLGDRRTVKKFAIFPVQVGNETRVFEYVKYVEEFKEVAWDNGEVGGVSREWVPVEFLNQ